MDFFSPCVWYAQRCSLKSATIIHVYQFFMQWNIIHKSVIHIWKQNFRIYIDALNINYVLRNSLVPIIFSPSPYFSLMVWPTVCRSVRLSICQSLCLSACVSLYTLYLFLWSWYFVVKSKSKHFDWCKWMDASICNV